MKGTLTLLEHYPSFRYIPFRRRSAEKPGDEPSELNRCRQHPRLIRQNDIPEERLQLKNGPLYIHHSV